MSLLNRALGMGRNLANGRMTETVTVGEFQDGTDPETGDPTRVLVTERYSGVGRVKYTSLAVSERSEPSQILAVREPYLSIPTGSPVARKGDEVVVSASSADESLVGRSYTVTGFAQAGQTTSHRYPLKEL